MMLFLVETFAVVLSRCCLYVKDLSSVTPKYSGVKLCWISISTVSPTCDYQFIINVKTGAISFRSIWCQSQLFIVFP